MTSWTNKSMVSMSNSANRVHHRRDVLAAAGQSNQVAGVVGPDDAAARRNALEQATDFRRGDEFELHHLQAGADLLGIDTVVCPEARANIGLIGRQDPILAAAIDERGVIGAERAAWNRSMTANRDTGFGVWIVILPSMPASTV